MSEFEKQYKRNLDILIKERNSLFKVGKDFQCDVGEHLWSSYLRDKWVDAECEFTTKHIRANTPKSILDIGSYRHYILGLLSFYDVTTVDIRPRKTILSNETMLVSSATNLPIRDNMYDLVLSLCTLEHIGLGRYGDEFDVDGDKKCFNEMIRVLKPGGTLVFTTTITRADPIIWFNAHRTYNYNIIHQFCESLTLVQEMFYSTTLKDYCLLEEVTTNSDNRWWDTYLGCWRKP